MGSGGSSSSSVDPNVPYLVYQAAKCSSGNTSKSQKLKDVIIEQCVWDTKGVIICAFLAEIECANRLGSLFGVHHAFMVVEFSSGVRIRCEVSTFEDGAAIFLNRIKNFSSANWQKFQCEYDGYIILDVIEWAKQFYRNGDFHVEKRNCFDFVAFMLQEDFQGADEVTKKWKRKQIKKVPSLLRD